MSSNRVDTEVWATLGILLACKQYTGACVLTHTHVRAHTDTHTCARTQTHTDAHAPTQTHTLMRAHSLPLGLRPGTPPALSAPRLLEGPCLLWGNPEGNHLRTRARGAGSCRRFAVWEKGVQENEEVARDQAKGAPLGQGSRERMLVRGSGGTGWKESLSPLLPSPQPHSWGQSPGHRKPGEQQGVPCVLGRH